MSRPTRRDVLLSTGALTLAGSPAYAAADALDAWLAANVLPIRSPDAMDDFTDLEPLAARLAGARIVQLGEPSHGAGGCFAAKARLVRFLHQRLGFDVLAWESGLVDVELVDAALDAGEAAVPAAQRGILKIWSASEECRTLFQYARDSRAGARPLTMAGFDVQFTGREGFTRFASDLRAFVGAVRDPALRLEAGRIAGEVVDAFAGFDAFLQARAARAAQVPPFPRREALERLQAGVEGLGRLLEVRRAEFAAVAGERRRGFMARALANLGGNGANLYETYAEDLPSPIPQVASSNRRDALMAETVRWLLEEGYPSRKIILWGHNAHLMNAYYQAPDFKTISLHPAPNTMKPVGVHLADWYGDAVYTIGFTAYMGADGWVGAPPKEIAPASENGLEARLHRLGHPHALLDVRQTRRKLGHPLRRRLSRRAPKYDEVAVEDPSQPYDAIFFIDRMRPATLVR